PALQNLVGGQPDRVFDPLRLQVLIDLWHGKGCVRPEIDARDLALTLSEPRDACIALRNRRLSGSL
ncbi:MAG: hypothetical protein WB677_03010, partial [Xanthobacteraceae bacterium]